MTKRSRGASELATNNASSRSQNDLKASTKRITMAELDEVSSSDDDGPMPPEELWDDDAIRLKKSIESGAFDKLLNKRHEDDDDSVEELDIGSSESGSSDRDSSCSDSDDNSFSNVGSETIVPNPPKRDAPVMNGITYSSVNEEASNEVVAAEPESECETIKEKNNTSSKALRSVTDNLKAGKKEWPWAETFDVTVPTPLPFGTVSSSNEDIVSIHDDLKREVAFYNTALEAVLLAKTRCLAASIPFSRPDDFFAEMVKTDEHMARVKDRLIFETKKMDAVAQRKSNKEHKLRSKEAQMNKQDKKAKSKRDHFKQLDEWAQSAAASRGKNLTDNDDTFLRSLSNESTKKSKKRQLADKKFGFGGKKGRFKQNDPKDYDNIKGFNVKGNFPGIGSKNSSSKTKNGAGANRKGKRARDATRGR